MESHLGSLFTFCFLVPLKCVITWVIILLARCSGRARMIADAKWWLLLLSTLASLGAHSSFCSYWLADYRFSNSD